MIILNMAPTGIQSSADLPSHLPGLQKEVPAVADAGVDETWVWLQRL